MPEFVRKHEDRIHGVLSCFDRMLFRGYLPIMSGWSMAQFFARIEDLPRAQRLSDRFAHLKWPRILNRYARQVVPQLDDVLYGCEYHWVAAQAEYSTDVMFKTAEGLREQYPRLLSHSTLCFGAKEVMNFDALAAVDDPTQAKQALQRLTTAKKDAAGRSCPGFNPLAQPDADLLKSLMDGEHCLRGFTNRDIRSQLTKTRWLRSYADDPKKASAKVGRCFRRLHAHGLIAKIPRTRRWRVTAYGHQAMGTSLYCTSITSPTSTPQQQWPDLLRERQRTHSERIYSQPQRLGDLVADRVQRVQRRHRLMEHQTDAVAAQLAHRSVIAPSHRPARHAEHRARRGRP